MAFLKQRKKKMFLDNNRGSAMITALVVGLVIFAFCLSMLLVSYTLFAQVSRQNTQLQCKNLAQSFSEELADMLEKGVADGGNVDLQGYLKEQIGIKLAAAKDELGPDSTEIPTATIDMKLKPFLDAGGELAVFDITVHFEATSINSVDAIITCVRGNENDRDVQKYSVSRNYRLK